MAMRGARTLLDELEKRKAFILTEFPELGPRVRKKAQREPSVLFDVPPEGEREEPMKNGHSEPRPKSKRRRRKRRVLSDKTKAGAVKRLANGAYLRDVARELDVVPTVLQRWADKAKVKVTPMPMEERIKRNQAARAGK